MKKDILRYIKKDMHEVLHTRKYFQFDVNEMKKELEADYKEAIDKNSGEEDEYVRACFNRYTRKNYEEIGTRKYNEILESYHNCQNYYIIYNDGSDVLVSAEDILAGTKLPKLSDIVYAELLTDFDWWDTENGDLSGKFNGEDGEYDPDLYLEYGNAINYKYGTKWAVMYAKEHPDYVPAVPENLKL